MGGRVYSGRVAYIFLKEGGCIIGGAVRLWEHCK